MLADHGSTNGSRIGPVTIRKASVQVDPGAVVSLGDAQVRVEDGAWVFGDEALERVAGIYGRSSVMRRHAAEILRIAASTASVCIGGESGTGKELTARAIHEQGPRAGLPFVTVDCAATSPNLFASELFGHERGSFTGAERRHVGSFERAHGGTLFLDEVGELNPECQASLLGAIERKTIRRVGGSHDIPIDIRIVTATHRDLRDDVNSGRFRLDLYYRLAVVRISIPPLRDRAEDIPGLITRFLEEAEFQGSMESLFDSRTIDDLSRHSWPGNVRELRNLVHATLALGHAPPLESASPHADKGSPVTTDLPYKLARREVLDRFEREYLSELLTRAGGNVRAAARAGQMDRMYLTELLRRHGLI